MKIIFLDCDGVLVTQPLFGTRYKNGNNKPFDTLDKNCVDKLNILIEKTGAKLVLSSTWRFDKEYSAIEYLNTNGVKGEFVGITPTSQTGIRGTEIQKFIEKFDGSVDKFVILDDDSDMEHLSCHLVKINMKIGLTDEDIEKALEILS